MKNLKKIFLRWEWLLVLLTVLVYVFFAAQIDKGYGIEKLMNQTRVYMVDVGFMALGAMLILILGDIDISVASTAALSVTIMGIAYNGGAGCPFWVAIILALLVGAVCGAINGILIVRFKELFPMIITLSTQTLYRGIAYIILKDQATGSFPAWFGNLGYAKVGMVPVMLICLLAVFPFFYIGVHKTVAGRRLFATGENIVAARYSGIRTDKIKMLMFTLNGILAAVGGIFLAARTGSVKYTIGTGYEMQAIAIAILGGASTAGGKGSVIGILLSLVLMTCLKHGLQLLYNDSFVLNMAVGVLLICIVLFPNIAGEISKRRELKKRRVRG